MIKINLLSEGRTQAAARQSRRRAPGGGGSSREWGVIALCAVLALAAIAVGVNFLLLRGKIADTNDKIVVAEEEVKRLEPIIREVEEFKAKKADLERKVEVINNLKNNQRGPVDLMDNVSRSLPELLWLTSMDVKGDLVSIQGQAFNTNAVAAFIENLDRVPAFQEPVLKDTSQKGRVYNFVITFNFSYARPSTEIDADAAG